MLTHSPMAARWVRRLVCAGTVSVATQSLAQDKPADENWQEHPEAIIADERPDDRFEFEPRLAIRANVYHNSWGASDSRSDAKYDTLMLGFDTAYEDIFASAQYRFYDGYSMLHHGYMGIAFDEQSQVQFGVTQKPFGLLPYASHNYFFNLGYYIGMEDDYDLGVKYILDREEVNFQFAYFLRDEGSYDGDSVDSARYSYDIVKTDAGDLASVGVTEAQKNTERNQFNGRLAYTLTHSENASTEFGISGEWGEIPNSTTNQTGDRYAAALHLNGVYDRINLQLQGARFENNLASPIDGDDRFLIRGAYDAPYKAAARGWLFIANVAYTLPIEASPGDSITFYTDYSYLLKDESEYNDSQQFVVGALFQIGAALIYTDFAFGRNQPFIGPAYSTALAEGDPDDDWEFRFNLNVGFYF